VAFTARSSLWIDVAGREVITLLRGDATLGGIETQVAALSNMGLFQCWEGAISTPGNAGGAGTFQAQDWAYIQYACVDGTEARVAIPGPLSSIFLADGRTVDPAALGALDGVVIGLLASASDSLAINRISGYRKSRTP
jgi:hypothetical protein